MFQDTLSNFIPQPLTPEKLVKLKHDIDFRSMFGIPIEMLQHNNPPETCGEVQMKMRMRMDFHAWLTTVNVNSK